MCVQGTDCNGRDFLPSTGTLVVHDPPASSSQVRVDTGVSSGDVVSVYYDPMIAKLIVHDVDRPTALRRLTTALEQYKVRAARAMSIFGN